jgi:hypothetical protein
VSPAQSVAPRRPASIPVRFSGAPSTVAAPASELSALRIHIEQLELRGIDRIDEERFTATLQSELRDLLAAKGIPSSWAHNQVLDRTETLPPSAARMSASWLGVQLARTIYNLRRPARP